MGVVLQDLGKLNEARHYIERGLRIEEIIFGIDHINVANYINNLGNVLRNLGDLTGARQHFERALRICTKSLGEDHPNTVLVRKNLASLD